MSAKLAALALNFLRLALLQHLARVLLALAHDGVKPVPLQPQLLPARVVAGDAKKPFRR